MRRVELEHAIRAATEIIAQDAIIVIGSQSILGTYTEDELPDQATQSVEVDMAPLGDDAAATLANKLDGAIGEWSMFHRTHGYYVQGVGRDTLIEAGLIDRAVLAERVEDMANADPRSKSTIRRYLKPFPG